MSSLFEPAQIGPMTVRNRFVRSATWEAMAAPDGAVTPRLVDLIADLAKGGVGLIISSHAFVSPEGQAGPGQVGVYKDDLAAGLGPMAAAGHQRSHDLVEETALGAQLVAVTAGATNDTPQYIATTFVGRQHTVGDQEPAGANMVGHNLE